MSREPGERIGYLLSDDLMFTSRVLGTARDLGVRMAVARTPDAFWVSAATCPPSCVLIDLANPGLNIMDLVNQIRQLTVRVRIIAYGSHVETDTLRRAREAGCDIVLPRSRFVEVLATQLASWLAPAEEA